MKYIKILNSKGSFVKTDIVDDNICENLKKTNPHRYLEISEKEYKSLNKKSYQKKVEYDEEDN